MEKQSIKSKAINAFATAIVRTLFGWVEKWGNESFFFIVFGDKTCTEVAWYNTDQLACDAALAITCDPKAAGAFSNISTSVEILMEDALEDEKFKEAFEKTGLDDPQEGWISYEDDPDCEQEKSKR